MKKKNIISENYLERIPRRMEQLDWSEDENGIVTLAIENKGAFNRLAQKLLKKPRISYVHLDEMGSFIWKLADGSKTILEMGNDVERHFGEAANPLYERLAKYFRILDSYNFIQWNNKK